MKKEETEKFIREEVMAGDKYLKAAYDLGVSDERDKVRKMFDQLGKEINLTDQDKYIGELEVEIGFLKERIKELESQSMGIYDAMRFEQKYNKCIDVIKNVDAALISVHDL